jgi:hypothetical protein
LAFIVGTYTEDQKREGSETNHKWMKLRGLKELHSSALTKEEQEDGRTKRKKQITRGRKAETQQCVPKSQIDVCAVKCPGARRNKMKVIGVLPVGWAPLTPSDLDGWAQNEAERTIRMFWGKNLRVKSFLGVKLGWEQFEQKHIHTLYIR